MAYDKRNYSVLRNILDMGEAHNSLESWWCLVSKQVKLLQRRLVHHYHT